MSALVMGEYESDFPTHQPLSLPSTLIFCKSPSFFSSRTTFDPFSSELPLKNVAHPICDTCCIDSIKAQFLTFHPLLFLLIIVLFIPLKLWRHFSMLKAPQALQYACRTANTKFSRNSTFSRSNLPQRSYNTRQFNIPEHDDRWKVLNKPFKPTYQLESIQTKRPVALKYVAHLLMGCFCNTRTSLTSFASELLIQGQDTLGPKSFQTELRVRFYLFQWFKLMNWS